MDPDRAAAHYGDDYNRRLVLIAQDIVRHDKVPLRSSTRAGRQHAQRDLGPKVQRPSADERLQLVRRYWSDVVGISDEQFEFAEDDLGFFKRVVAKFSHGLVHTSGHALSGSTNRHRGTTTPRHPLTRSVSDSKVLGGRTCTLGLVALDFFPEAGLRVRDAKVRGHDAFDAHRPEHPVAEVLDDASDVEWPARSAAAASSSPGAPEDPAHRSYVPDVLWHDLRLPVSSPFAESPIATELWERFTALGRSRQHHEPSSAAAAFSDWWRSPRHAGSASDREAVDYMLSTIARVAAPFLVRAEVVHLSAETVAQLPDWSSDRAFVSAAYSARLPANPALLSFDPSLGGPLRVSMPESDREYLLVGALVWRDELRRLNIVPAGTSAAAADDLVPFGRVVFGRADQRLHDRTARDRRGPLEAPGAPADLAGGGLPPLTGPVRRRTDRREGESTPKP